MSASGSPKIVPAGPQAWRKAFLNLRLSVVPCPGFTAHSWAGVHEKAVDVLDRCADGAVALGWTTFALFGVHPEAGIVRPDFCGAIVMSDAKVTTITANRIGFVNTAFSRDTPGRPTGAVPIWAFKG
jgi:hypothetical protein